MNKTQTKSNKRLACNQTLSLIINAHSLIFKEISSIRMLESHVVKSDACMLSICVSAAAHRSGHYSTQVTVWGYGNRLRDMSMRPFRHAGRGHVPWGAWMQEYSICSSNREPFTAAAFASCVHWWRMHKHLQSNKPPLLTAAQRWTARKACCDWLLIGSVLSLASAVAAAPARTHPIELMKNEWYKGVSILPCWQVQTPYSQLCVVMSAQTVFGFHPCLWTSGTHDKIDCAWRCTTTSSKNILQGQFLDDDAQRKSLLACHLAGPCFIVKSWM